MELAEYMVGLTNSDLRQRVTGEVYTFAYRNECLAELERRAEQRGREQAMREAASLCPPDCACRESMCKPEPPTTIREWLMTLPSGYRERAVANYDPGFVDGESASNLGSAIGDAFAWHYSREGSRFWSRVHNWARDSRNALPPLPDEREDYDPGEHEPVGSHNHDDHLRNCDDARLLKDTMYGGIEADGRLACLNELIRREVRRMGVKTEKESPEHDML